MKSSIFMHILYKSALRISDYLIFKMQRKHLVNENLNCLCWRDFLGFAAVNKAIQMRRCSWIISTWNIGNLSWSSTIYLDFENLTTFSFSRFYITISYTSIIFYKQHFIIYHCKQASYFFLVTMLSKFINLLMLYFAI